jgi:DNA-directed RNA polymerase II subunit RPB2
VKDGAIQITPDIIQKLKDGIFNWNHLIGGTSADGILDYYSCLYQDDISLEALEKHSSVIEYIDVDEANTCIIACSQSDIRNNPTVKYTHCEIDPSLILGVLGATIPFIGCNQAPRNQFSNAQGKQGVGIYATNFRNRMDTKTQVLLYPQRPIIDTKYGKYLGVRDIPFGQNIILAIGSYTGYNQEDAIIMNKTSIERGMFRSVKFHTYSEHEEQSLGSNQKIFFCVPDQYNLESSKKGNYSKLDNRGIIKEGTHIKEDDVIVGKCIKSGKDEETGSPLFTDCSTYAKRVESGVVDKVFHDTSSDDMKFCKIRIRKDKIPELGDKFASKHGQKGVIGMLIAAEDMPMTKEGIVPDMIINPFGFPKRMTVGQFLEALFSKVCVNRGCFGDGTAFHDYDIKNLSNILEKHYKYEKYCNELVYNGRTGEQMKMNIFI